MSKQEKFQVEKIIKISDLVSGEVKDIPTADLCVQHEGTLVHFKLIEEDKPIRDRFVIKPGVFNIVKTMSGLILDEFKIKQPSLLESINNTSTIMSEVNFFFNRLNVYEELGLEKKRALLLYGAPGTGKTASIARVCNKLIEEDKGTVIINWNSASIESEGVLDFFSSASTFDSNVTRMVLIIEDIGSNHEAHYGTRGVDRSLLNFLDGVGVNFAVPTFILATTNYASNLPENLADRPGRFDRMIEIPPPGDKERVQLMKFIAKRDLTSDESGVIGSKLCDGFSIAHLKEIVVRSRLNEKSFKEVASDMVSHSKKFSKGFENGGNMGLN